MSTFANQPTEKLFNELDNQVIDKNSSAYLELIGQPKLPAGESFIIAISDESTAISTGTGIMTFRMPYAFSLIGLPRASLTVSSSSGIPTFDINESGNSILGTKLTIDAGELTSQTAVVPCTLIDTSLADDAQMTIDIDVSGTGAKGAKIYLIGRKT